MAVTDIRNWIVDIIFLIMDIYENLGYPQFIPIVDNYYPIMVIHHYIMDIRNSIIGI